MNQKEVWDFLNTHHLSDTYCKNVGFHTSSDLLKTKLGTGGIQINLKFLWLVCNLYSRKWFRWSQPDNVSFVFRQTAFLYHENYICYFHITSLHVLIDGVFWGFFSDWTVKRIDCIYIFFLCVETDGVQSHKTQGYFLPSCIDHWCLFRPPFVVGLGVLACATRCGGRSEAGHCFHLLFSSAFHPLRGNSRD